MKLILALEITFWLFITYLVVRQVVVPLWKNEQMFPMFRKRRDLEVKLKATKTAVGDYELLQQIRAEAEKLPNPEPPTQILPKSSPIKSTAKKTTKR